MSARDAAAARAACAWPHLTRSRVRCAMPFIELKGCDRSGGHVVAGFLTREAQLADLLGEGCKEVGIEWD